MRSPRRSADRDPDRAHVATCHETPDGRALLLLFAPRGVGLQTNKIQYSGGTTRRMADGRTTLLTRQPTRSYVTFLFILVGSFFLVFSCFNAAQSLDGSIPAPPGLAAIQFCVLYVTFGLLCIPAPKVISLTGPKWGIAVGMLTYVSLVASFLAPPYCTAKQEHEHEHHSGDCWSVELIWALRLVTAVLLSLIHI